MVWMENLTVRSRARLLERLLALHNVMAGVDDRKESFALGILHERTDGRYSTDLVVITR